MSSEQILGKDKIDYKISRRRECDSVRFIKSLPLKNSDMLVNIQKCVNPNNKSIEEIQTPE